MRTAKFCTTCLAIGLGVVLPRPAASQPYQFTKILDGSTQRPDGSPFGIAFAPTTPSFDGKWVVFRDPGPQNSGGTDAAIFAFNTLDNTFHKLVDLNTSVPGSAARFSDLDLLDTAPFVRNGTVVFVAYDNSAPFRQGLYFVPAAGGSIAKLADYNTPDPSGGTFTLFDTYGKQAGAFSFDGTTVAFNASGSGGTLGNYSAKPGSLSLALVADNLRPYFTQNGVVSNFTDPVVSGNGIVMIGTDALLTATGYNGIYLGTVGGNGTVTELVNSTQQLPGNPDPNFHTRFDGPILAFDGTLVVFRAHDTNSSFFGLYSTDLTSHTINKIVDVNSTLPGLGKLQSIASDSIAVSSGSVLFRATDTVGNTGLYIWKGGGVSWVIGTGASLGGHTVQGLLDPGPAALSGSGLVFNVDFGAPFGRALYVATLLSPAGTMTHLASGAGWSSTVTLVNTGAVQSQLHLGFFDNSGIPLTLPLSSPQSPSTPQWTAATVDDALNGGASLVLTSPNGQTGLEGSGRLFTAGNIGGFAIFRHYDGQEAAVPLETRNASSYLLSFDNTGGVGTGVAIANVSSTDASIRVAIRDDTGASLAPDRTLSLAAQGHTSFMLIPTYAVTANKRGTLEFFTPTGGQISVLGLRFAPTGVPNSFAVTTLPVLANVVAGGGSMAHLASGAGWQTTFTLVNTGAASAQARLGFYDDTGAPLSLPLSFPQTGATITTSVLNNLNLSPGETKIITAQPAGNASAVGSARLTANGGIGGFAVFRYNPTGQEAVVPLETRNAAAYVLPFDNTGGAGTGLAVANVASSAAKINVVLRDDAGASLGSASAISLLVQGHSSFMLTDLYALTAGKRGTVELDPPIGGQISVLGLRFAPTGVPGSFAVTTLPVLAK